MRFPSLMISRYFSFHVVLRCLSFLSTLLQTIKSSLSEIQFATKVIATVIEAVADSGSCGSFVDPLGV
ncbi:hypothetical protein B9Z19DRAFT_52418 [Tuber borchii]|uniref:Uncharacterized protein n=1 Tax=Tuber borchii TaxID=42251 RepID=A0A2T7A710_TUBBO|nr:hypothetical protein B9Z19DRAFT_52418 [Tuber borchii]